MKKQIFYLFLWLAIPLQAQWEFQNSGTTADLNDVYCISADTVVVVGNNATILRTTNGGTTWNFITNSASGNLYKVQFTGSQTGYATGDNGTLLQTTDAGQTWQSINTGTTENLLALSVQSVDTLYVAGTNGLILKSEDGGVNWTMINSGTAHSINQIKFFVAGTGYALYGDTYSWNCNLMKTNNDGNSWYNLSIGNSEIFSCFHFINASEAYVGSLQNLYKTIDGGSSFQFIEYFDTVSVIDIDVVQNTIWNCGVNAAACDCPNYISKTVVINNNADTTSYYSQRQCGAIYDYEYYNAIDFYDETTGYTVGDCGFIWKNSTGINGMNQNENNIFSIKPNPVKNDIHILLKNTNDDFEYRIVDMQGKVKQSWQKINGFKVNVSNLPAGIYLVELQNDKNFYTQKFIKL